MENLKVNIKCHIVSEYRNIATLAIVMDGKLTDIMAVDLEAL